MRTVPRLPSPNLAEMAFTLVLALGSPLLPAQTPADNLLFVHHSSGGNWLDSGLRDALVAKPYVETVNEVTYGTSVSPDPARPQSLGSVAGDSTDMLHWILWFNDYLGSLKRRDCGTGVANRIIMFKSCFPLSNVYDNGTEPGDPFSGDQTLANYRAIFRHPDGRGHVYLLDGTEYRALDDVFAANPATLFIYVTSPSNVPSQTCNAWADRSRVFDNWVKTTWLDSYNAAHPGLNNVAVFDWFDVLANPAAYAGTEVFQPADGSPGGHYPVRNMTRSSYRSSSSDSHPNTAANLASTKVFATNAPNFIDTVWAAFDHPRFDCWRDDRLGNSALTDPGASPAGWGRFGFNSALGWSDHTTEAGGAYRGHVAASADKFRTAGAAANAQEWLPWSVVGAGRVARAKFLVYAGGQANPADPSEIPNFRLRLSNRFAVNSMLEVFHHDPAESAAIQTLYADLRPSALATSPSIYRVDFRPVDVPYLESNAATEGIQAAFETYAIYPQENGYVAVSECVLGTYSSAVVTAGGAAKVYATGSADAGDLAVFASPPDAEVSLSKIVPGVDEGAFGTVDTVPPLPTHDAGAFGVTLDTTAVGTDRIGVATRNFNPDRGTNAFAGRVRVEEGKQYSVRFHLTSAQYTNRQAQIRLRCRAIKFGWSQKFEIGGAWGTGGGSTYPLNQNNSVAQQALPGVGCENPDQLSTGEAGGWYTLLMATPMSPGIRPELPAAAPLSLRMPAITAQPGPGVASASRRDLLLGVDLVDTLSAGAGRFLEQGSVTVDRVEVRAFGLVPD